MTNVAVSFGDATPVQRMSSTYHPKWQRVSTVVEPDQSKTEYIYTNGVVQTIKRYHAETGSHDTHLGYNKHGWLVSQTNANGQVSRWVYDEAGNLVRAIPAGGMQQHMECNALGFVTNRHLLAEDGIERDAHGRATALVHPDGLISQTRYNALGDVVQRTDRAGRATDYEYVPTRLKSVTRYLNDGGSNVPVRVGYKLDELTNVLSIEEPGGRYVEAYQLDIQDRVVSVTNIEGQVSTVGYVVGQMVDRVVRFDGTTISSRYNAAGLVSNRTYGVSEAVGYSYHPDGRLKQVSDSAGSVKYRYDPLNRLTFTQHQATDANQPSQTVWHDVDPMGRMVRSTALISYNGGFPWHFIDTIYSNDVAQRMVSSGYHRYGYSPENGRMAQVSNTVSGIAATYAYDLLDRITNITYTAGNGQLIRAIDYQRDAVGLVTRKTIRSPSTSPLATRYAYDSLDRLIGEATSGESIVYRYDLAGNRTVRHGNAASTTYTLGRGNRLDSIAVQPATNVMQVFGTSSELIGTDPRWGWLEIRNLDIPGSSVVPSVNGHRFSALVPVLAGRTNLMVAAICDQAGNVGYATNRFLAAERDNSPPPAGKSYAHNTAGCLVRRGTQTLGWDERYRLTAVTNVGGSVVKYGYDVLGRKMSRTASGRTQYFIHDGPHVLADMNSDETLARIYSHGHGVDNILSFTTYRQNRSVATYQYIKDHLNTVLALADTTGLVVESYSYDGYGSITVFDAQGRELERSAYGNRFTLQGREIDWDTGLYHFSVCWHQGRTVKKSPHGRFRHPVLAWLASATGDHESRAWA